MRLYHSNTCWNKRQLTKAVEARRRQSTTSSSSPASPAASSSSVFSSSTSSGCAAPLSTASTAPPNTADQEKAERKRAISPSFETTARVIQWRKLDSDDRPTRQRHKRARTDQVEDTDDSGMTGGEDETDACVPASNTALRRHRMFADDSAQTFFRRLSFTPDGSMLVSLFGGFHARAANATNCAQLCPSGQYIDNKTERGHCVDDESDDLAVESDHQRQQPPLPCTYVFLRDDDPSRAFKRPAAVWWKRKSHRLRTSMFCLD